MALELKNEDGFEKDLDFKELIRDICEQQEDKAFEDYIEKAHDKIFEEDELLQILEAALVPVDSES